MIFLNVRNTLAVRMLKLRKEQTKQNLNLFFRQLAFETLKVNNLSTQINLLLCYKKPSPSLQSSPLYPHCRLRNHRRSRRRRRRRL